MKRCDNLECHYNKQSGYCTNKHMELNSKGMCKEIHKESTISKLKITNYHTDDNQVGKIKFSDANIEDFINFLISLRGKNRNIYICGQKYFFIYNHPDYISFDTEDLVDDDLEI